MAAVTGAESGLGRALEWRVRGRQEQQRVRCKLPDCDDFTIPGGRERGKEDRDQTLDFSHIDQHSYCQLCSFASLTAPRPNVGGHRHSSRIILSCKSLPINGSHIHVLLALGMLMEMCYIDLQPQGGCDITSVILVLNHSAERSVGRS